MDDAMTVQVVERLHELLSNFTHLWLSQVAIIFKDLEKLTLSKLCDDTELVRCFK